MCGIFGIVGVSDKRLIEKMSLAMEHRGPDQRGFFLGEDTCIGMNRLSIIDTSKIEVPLTNESRTLHLAFNGEIYNYKAMQEKLEANGHIFASNTDSEVIVHLFEEKGEACLKQLNGMFAIAIWDSVKKELFLARDRVGIKPLFYYFNGQRLVFASEVGAILATGFVKPKVNLSSMERFLTFRYNFGPETLFEGIQRLNPGELLIFRNGKIELKQYWDITPSAQRDERKALEEMDMLMGDSVRLMLQSDVKLGIFLSGGIDSSAIAWYAKRIVNKVETFSMDVGKNWKAQLVARSIGTRHRAFTFNKHSISILPKIIRQLGEPLADPIAIPTYLLAKEVSKHCTVVLSGEGGDEIFGGYEQYRIMGLASKYFSRTPALLKKANEWILSQPFFPKNLYEFHSNLSRPAISYTSLVSSISRWDRQNLLANPTLHIEAHRFDRRQSLLFNMQYFDTKRFLPEDNLFRLDGMLMAHSMEGRVPFLDHRIVNFGFGLPDSLRQKGNETKIILRKLMAKRLPKEIVNAKKERWIFPTDDWFPTRAFRAVFSDPELQKFFKMEYVNRLIGYKNSAQYKLFSVNPLTRLYYSRQLWNLLCFGVWYREFIRGEKTDKIFEKPW